MESSLEVYEAFQQIVAKKGVTVHQIQGAEADDVIFGWSTMLNARGKSCIVWTGDRDLIQLVNYSTTNDSVYSGLAEVNVKIGDKIFSKEVIGKMSNDDLMFNMKGSCFNSYNRFICYNCRNIWSFY